MTDNLDKARAAWGDLPDWVMTLARACDASSQNKVAAKLGLSSGTVSRLILNGYNGDLAEMRRLTLARLVDDTVECEAFGAPIRPSQCLDYRRGRTVRDAAWRAVLTATCPDCPHNMDRAEP